MPNKKNIFLIKWDYNDEDNLEIARRLENQGYHVAYWVGISPENVKAENAREFSQTSFHNVYEALAGTPAPRFREAEFYPPDEELIKSLAEAEVILSTIKQFEKLKTSVLAKKSVYYGYLGYWLGVLEELKPEAVIFAVVPHTGFDFILFSLAKLLKIKTIIFEYEGIADRHIVFNDYTVGSDELRKEIAADRERQSSLEDLDDDIKKYYLELTDKRRSAVQEKIRGLNNKYSGLNSIWTRLKSAKRAAADLTLFKKMYFYLLNRFGKNFRKEYIDVQSRVDLNKKFIYAALHYQPEAATAPLGGVFVDQLLAIKTLACSLPEDWIIYVKEHPVQWLANGLNYTTFRYPGYYSAIAAVKNVKIIPLETPAQEMIDNCQAVATITGTVGREALMRLKPVIIFGYPNYRDCPGVFKVNGAGSCREAFKKINSGFKITEREIINFFYSLGKISFHTYFEKLSKVESKLTSPEHVEIMVKVMKKELEK